MASKASMAPSQSITRKGAKLHGCNGPSRFAAKYLIIKSNQIKALTVGCRRLIRFDFTCIECFFGKSKLSQRTIHAQLIDQGAHIDLVVLAIPWVLLMILGLAGRERGSLNFHNFWHRSTVEYEEQAEKDLGNTEI